METTQLGADHAMTTGSTASAAGMHGPAHMPSMALVPLDQVTHTAVQSGDWSDPATWGGAVPGEGAKVHVPAGLRVTVDTTLAPEIKTLRVDGTLDFATDRTTELRVDTLVTTTLGTLEIGTAAAPIAEGVTATIVFADDGAIDQNWDPTLVSRGAILHGTTTIYGAQKAAFTALETQPLAGATEITLDAPPSGWRVGDTIAIAGTDPKDPTTDETRVITEIVGNTVRFAVPLERDHVAPRPDLDVHVANLTRNVVFTSENTAIDHRGHVMVMHTNDADVNFAAFDDLGRSDKTVPYDDWVLPELNPVEPELLGGDNVRGRYSFHVHRGGTDKDDDPAKVNGSVVTDGPGWGFVNHSSNVNFTNNVTHNLVGAAYYTEAGDEIGSFIGNLAMRTVNPTFPLETGEPVENSIADNGIPQRSSFLGEEGVGAPTDPGGRELRQDYGFQGDGFWFHGPNVQVENNVVSGASGHAYIWWAEGLIERFPDGSVRQATHDTANVPGGDLIGPDGTRLQVYDTPIGSFVGNEGYSATVGLQFFYFQTEVFGDGVNVNAGVPVPPAAYDAQLRSTLSDVTIWNVEKKGLDAPYVNRVTLENSTFIGAGDPASVGIDLDHPHTARGWELRNVTVEDFGIGLQAPRQGDFLLDGGTFANLTDVEISEVQRGARDLTFRDLTLAPLANALSGQEAGRTNYDLAFSSNVDPEVRRTEWDPLWFLQPDRIVVETTGGERVGLFFPNQSADYIPVPVGDPLAAALPAEVVGLTNQQLWDQYGLSFGGGILPDDAARGTSGPTGVFTDGFVGSPLPAPVLYPPFAEFNPDDINAPIGYVDEGRNFAVETGFQPRAAASSDPTPPPPSSGSPTPMPPAPIPTPNPSSPVDSGTIGFVGDSITARAADEAFITYLASSYSDTRFQAAAVGSAGVTSQAGNRIQDSPEYQQLLASDASLVWLMIGGNDILGGASLSEYRAGLEAVIAELKAMPSAPQIVIAAQPPFFEAEPEAHAIFRAEWIPAMQAIAAAQGAGFVDVNAAVTDYPTNYPDDIHPNATAAANLATIIGEALEGLGVLGDGAPPPLQDLPPPPAAGDPDMPDEDNVPDDGAPAMPIDDATLAKLYIVFYGRMPDTPGFEHWSGVAEARPDLGLMDFASLFATAAEFDALYGSLSAAEIVTSFYRQVLGRDPEPEGLSHWTGVLEDDPDTGLMALALGFVTAQETDQIHGAAIEAFLATPTSEASGDVFTFPVTFEVIADFDAAIDRIDISGRGTAADVEVLDEPEGSTLLLDGGDLFLPGVDAEDITTDSFIF